MRELMGTINDTLERIARIGRGAAGEGDLSEAQREKLAHLRDHGYVVFDHLVGTDRLKRLQADYRKRVEEELDFQFPTLAQAKIDPVRDATLIKNNFLATPQKLQEFGLAFSREDVTSYEQAVAEFAPSTLTTDIPDDQAWFDVWLDREVTPLVAAYMGFVPQLIEAYIRRNFPARFPVMNHAWHRDTNHRTHLLKMFVFLTDCTLKTGPHHYIAGSVQDRRVDGKTYYSDEEIHRVYPPESNREIISVVPAGTIILEDTRGLHKAGIPEEGYRDLGYATFIPPIALRQRDAYFRIGRKTFELLSPEQQKFVPASSIKQ